MRHSYFEWAISGSPTPPDPKPRESLSRPAAPHSDPRKTPGPGSSWADCGPRLLSSPTPAASSQASSSVVALPTTAEMQRPLSWGLWATSRGRMGAGEAWQKVVTLGPQADQGGGGKRPEVRVGMSGQEGWWEAGMTGAALTHLAFGTEGREPRQGRGHGSPSRRGPGTERPCTNPRRLSGRAAR